MVLRINLLRLQKKSNYYHVFNYKPFLTFRIGYMSVSFF